MDILIKILDKLNEQNKSQKDLTDFLGIHSNNFTNWKNGRNTSYLKYISQIAEYLNVSTDYLLGSEYKNNPSEDTLDEFENKILILARTNGKQLDKKDKDKLVKIFESSLKAFLDNNDK